MKKLSLNRETLKMLTPTDAALVRGGAKKVETETQGVTSQRGCDVNSNQTPCSSACKSLACPDPKK